MSTNDDKNIYLPYRMTIEKITLEAPEEYGAFIK